MRKEPINEILLRRIKKEYKKLSREPAENFELFEYGKDPLKWHFVYRGPKDTVVEGGEYHGDIIFKNFPYLPPELVIDTPTGRFPEKTQFYAIDSRWWDSSMTVKDLLNDANSTFIYGAPKVEGYIFKDSCTLKILAELSKSLGCDSCKKKYSEAPNNEERARQEAAYQKIIDDYNGRGIGIWWNEYRLMIIRNTEIELERLPKCKYYYFCESLQAKLDLILALLNWKYVARNVLFPIIYHYFLVTIVLACLGLLVVIFADSEFKWLVKGFAIVDFILLVLIALRGCKAIQIFTNRRAVVPISITLFEKLLTLTYTAVTLLHFAIAMLVSVLATRETYKEKRTIVIFYIVTAFAHDIYHYLIDILVYLSMPVILLCNAVEYLATRKARAKLCIATFSRCVDEDLKTCHLCKSKIFEHQCVIHLNCNGEHTFHERCLLEICRGIKRCPLCKKPYRIVTEMERIHIGIKE